LTATTDRFTSNVSPLRVFQSGRSTRFPHFPDRDVVLSFLTRISRWSTHLPPAGEKLGSCSPSCACVLAPAGVRPKELEGFRRLPVGCSAQGPMAMQSDVDQFGFSLFCCMRCSRYSCSPLFAQKGRHRHEPYELSNQEKRRGCSAGETITRLLVAFWHGSSRKATISHYRISSFPFSFLGPFPATSSRQGSVCRLRD
jgi:hypothetical protein